jgi:hypothetical protein
MTCVLGNIKDYNGIVKVVNCYLSSLVNLLEHVDRQRVHFSLHEVEEVLEFD